MVKEIFHFPSLFYFFREVFWLHDLSFSIGHGIQGGGCLHGAAACVLSSRVRPGIHGKAGRNILAFTRWEIQEKFAKELYTSTDEQEADQFCPVLQHNALLLSKELPFHRHHCRYYVGHFPHSSRWELGKRFYWWMNCWETNNLLFRYDTSMIVCIQKMLRINWTRFFYIHYILYFFQVWLMVFLLVCLPFTVFIHLSFLHSSTFSLEHPAIYPQV